MFKLYTETFKNKARCQRLLYFRAIIQFGISSSMIFYLAPPELIAVSLGGIAGIVVISKFAGKFIQKYSREQQKWTASASKARFLKSAFLNTNFKEIFVIFEFNPGAAGCNENVAPHFEIIFERV